MHHLAFGLDIHMSDQERMVSVMPKCACVIPLCVFSNLNMLLHQKESFITCPGTLPFEQ
jgi:hypothetical protein